MREQLLIELHEMIQKRLNELGQPDYDWDLRELNDPVIDTILELRSNIFKGVYSI